MSDILVGVVKKHIRYFNIIAKFNETDTVSLNNNAILGIVFIVENYLDLIVKELTLKLDKSALTLTDKIDNIISDTVTKIIGKKTHNPSCSAKMRQIKNYRWHLHYF